MVARTPPKQRKVMVAPLNPALLRETVKKVDKCMARLQELQYTVAGGNKVISGVSLSPRSTRGYLRASLRCKQESLRMKIATPKKSPVGKMPQIAGGEWRRMSLPAMLVGETIGEILQASQFAKEIVAAVSTNKTQKKITPLEDPKTPITQKKTTQNTKNLENTDLKTRRKKEKHNKLQSLRSESDRPSLQRARSRINFKVSSPPKVQELVDKENSRYLANRVSPRNRPWAKKTVLFPNPLFLSATPTSHQQKFGKTRSPIITRKSNNVVNHTKQTPHKFLIKSPVKIRSPQKVVASISPTKLGNLSKKSSSSPLKVSTASKLRRSFSPSRLASPKVVASISPTKLGNLSKKSSSSPLKVSTASKLRRSFSPSRLASRLVSPLKSRKNVQRCDGLMSGLKQRPPSSLVPMRFSTGRI